MNVIDEEESESQSSSLDDGSLQRPSLFDREPRSYTQRSVTQEESLDRGMRFSTFVSAYEEPAVKSESMRLPVISEPAVYTRTGGRRHSQATRDEENTVQSGLRKSFVRLSVDDSVLPSPNVPDHSPRDRKPDRLFEPRKNPTVEMFPLLVRGLETNKSNEISFRRSDSAFEVKTVTDPGKKEKEEEADRDDGKTGGSLMYKAKVDYLYKLAIGHPKPQDVLYKLLLVQPNAEGIDTGITGLAEIRNSMKEKELLAAAGKELAELAASYRAISAEKCPVARDEIETAIASLTHEIEANSQRIKRETENIVSRSFSIKDAHRRHIMLCSTLNSNINNQREQRIQKERLLDTEKETAEAEEKKLAERGERMDMRTNELETILADVDGRKERKRQKAERCSATIEKMRDERGKQRQLEGKIRSALELLQDTLQYVKEFADREDFIVFSTQDEYVDELKLLQKECLEAAEAERRFEEQATTDPRKLLPYSRSTLLATFGKI